MPIRPPAPRRRLLLVAMNLGLLGLLAAVTWSSSAAAQAEARARGRYLAVSGGVPGTDADVVWIVDTVNQEMVALTWDSDRKQIIGVGYRDLALDTAAALRGGGR
jgi:hypothetical protein